MVTPLVVAVVSAVVVTAIAASRRRASAWPLHGFGPAAVLHASGDAPRRVDADVHRRLQEWASAGLITPDEVDAVEAYEADRAGERPSRVPLVAEALGYVGGSLVLASLAVLVGRGWEDMAVAWRVAVLAAPTAVFAAVGAFVGRRAQEPLRRLGSVLWVLAGATLAGTLTEVWVDVVHRGDPPDHGGVAFVAAVTSVAMAAAWWVRREPLQLLAMFAACVATVVGVVDAMTASGEEISATWLGLGLFGFAAIWLVAGLSGRLAPGLVAVLVGAALLTVSPQFVRADGADLGLWLGIGSALVLMGAGVVRSEIVALSVGTIGLFQWSPQIALYYLQDVIGAEATLAVIGTLLLVLAGAIARLYPTLRARVARPGSELTESSDEAGPDRGSTFAEPGREDAPPPS